MDEKKFKQESKGQYMPRDLNAAQKNRSILQGLADSLVDDCNFLGKTPPNRVVGSRSSTAREQLRQGIYA